LDFMPHSALAPSGQRCGANSLYHAPFSVLTQRGFPHRDRLSTARRHFATPWVQPAFGGLDKSTSPLPLPALARRRTAAVRALNDWLEGQLARARLVSCFFQPVLSISLPSASSSPEACRKHAALRDVTAHLRALAHRNGTGGGSSIKENLRAPQTQEDF